MSKPILVFSVCMECVCAGRKALRNPLSVIECMSHWWHVTNFPSACAVHYERHGVQVGVPVDRPSLRLKKKRECCENCKALLLGEQSCDKVRDLAECRPPPPALLCDGTREP